MLGMLVGMEEPLGASAGPVSKAVDICYSDHWERTPPACGVDDITKICVSIQHTAELCDGKSNNRRKESNAVGQAKTERGSCGYVGRAMSHMSKRRAFKTHGSYRW